MVDVTCGVYAVKCPLNKGFVMRTLRSTMRVYALGPLIASAAVPLIGYSADDGTQMNESFRINYAGYLPQASKLAFYLAPNRGAIQWQIQGTNCSGSSDRYVSNDKSSGDSFYVIDFSDCTQQGANLRVQVGQDQSLPFDISLDPYGDIKYKFFDYFRDHETSATFTNAKNNWATGLSLEFRYVRDAGDNGAYPTNTAEASWALINLLETYPDVNRYYADGLAGARTVYDQLKILTEQFHHVLAHGGVHAIPKFHTSVNPFWADCSPHSSGTCISEPETKATFATARAMAAMARVHQRFNAQNDAEAAYALAQRAWDGARNNPVKCNQPDAFGGEGGFYPDNDPYSLWRDPKTVRDNCFPDQNNTEDDEYSAAVELYLAALKLNRSNDASQYRSIVVGHPRFDEATSYWWGAVATEGSLSLLSNEALHDIDLSNLKSKLTDKANAILGFQNLGYPGVTWDPSSTQWNTGDQDNVDNNVRWGSHRMALNDARILIAVAEIHRSRREADAAAKYARGALKVMDHISGLNPLALTMFTANGHPQFEHAIERTHDGADGTDSWAGKMVLGPNNWTNADDEDMPEFGSQPGLKMFALTGTGWASREISIDANASLVPVAYFTTEVAPAILAGELPQEPEPPIPDPPQEPEPPQPEPPSEPGSPAAGSANGLSIFGMATLMLLRRLRSRNRS